MKKILLVGYSGQGNFGDDLLLFQAYEYFRTQAKLAIWSSNLSSYSAYLKQWFPEAEIIKTKRLNITIFRDFDGVVYFGGGVFFDYMSKYPHAKYLKKRLGNFINYNISKVFKTRFVGIGIGLGPFRSENAIKINKNLLKNFDFVTVRDDESYNIAKSYRIPTEIYKGFDLSFLSHNRCDTPPQKTNSKAIKSILLCPRVFPHGSDGDIYHSKILAWSVAQQNKGKLSKSTKTLALRLAFGIRPI